MTAEIICIGTELLMGNTVNTNATFISRQLADLGIFVYYHTVVGDNPGRLKEAVKLALSRADIILTSGGLGPTEDDLTKETVCEAMGTKLVEDPYQRERLESYFARIIKGKEMTQNNYKQAMIPVDGYAIDNHHGTAPGIVVEKDGKMAILMPGVPHEMKSMFTESVKPILEKLSSDRLFSKMIKICGRGESSVETDILDIIDNQTNPTIAPYAKVGEVHLRITAKAENEKEADKLIEPMASELRRRFGKKIFTEDENVDLEDALIEIVSSKGYKISTAESCTGGLISGRLINAAGASACINECYVTYSNEAKERLVGVSHETLEKYGAVSEQTAREMAEGACRASGANIGLSSTGIAGPGGGSEEKPVGLVYIGCTVDGVTRVKECHFKGTRQMNRNYTVQTALVLLWQCLNGIED